MSARGAHDTLYQMRAPPSPPSRSASALSASRSSLSSLVLGAVRVTLTLLLVFSTATLLSLLTLVMVRHRYVPAQTSIVRDVRLDFTQRAGDFAEAVLPIMYGEEEPAGLFDFEDEADGAAAAMGWRRRLPTPLRSVSREDSTLPEYRLLNVGDRYDLSLTIKLPESAYNHDSSRVGVFQVTTELLSVDGRLAYSASVPALVQYKSALVYYTQVRDIHADVCTNCVRFELAPRWVHTPRAAPTFAAGD